MYIVFFFDFAEYSAVRLAETVVLRWTIWTLSSLYLWDSEMRSEGRQGCRAVLQLGT